MRTLVILGGGTAGTMAANKLRARLAAEEWQIIVIDKDDNVYVGDRTNQRVQVFDTNGTYIEVRMADIERVDAEARLVHLGDGSELGYDYLIMATGTTPRPDQPPGMLGPEWRKSVHEFYTYDGMLALKKSLKDFQGGRLVMHITELPIKCPVAPLEFVMLADDFLTKKGVRAATEIGYVTPLTRPPPVHAKHQGRARLHDRVGRPGGEGHPLL